MSGRDRRELFEQVAHATFAVCARPRDGWPERLESVTLAIAGDDDAGRVKRIGGECLYLFESRGFLAREAVVDAAGAGAADSAGVVTLRLRGAAFDADELEVLHVLKAATWHGLEVRADGAGVQAELLFDL